jgi:magnesium transporter
MVPAAAAAALVPLEAERAGAVLAGLGVDAAVAVVRRLPADVAGQVLAAMPLPAGEQVRRVLRFPEGTAGASMDPAIFVLPDDITVAEARTRLRRAGRDLLYYLYVVDREQRLAGVLDIPELLRARARDRVGTVMHADVQRIEAWTPAGAVHRHPGWHTYHAMPVVDERGRLLGAIRYQTLRRLERDATGPQPRSPGADTALALGELFRVGLTGLVDAVTTGGSLAAGDAGRSGGGAR